MTYMVNPTDFLDNVSMFIEHPEHIRKEIKKNPIPALEYLNQFLYPWVNRKERVKSLKEDSQAQSLLKELYIKLPEIFTEFKSLDDWMTRLEEDYFVRIEDIENYVMDGYASSRECMAMGSCNYFIQRPDTSFTDKVRAIRALDIWLGDESKKDMPDAELVQEYFDELDATDEWQYEHPYKYQRDLPNQAPGLRKN